MAVAGNLRTMGFADLLQWLSAAQKTGTLIIDGVRFTKKVYMRRGQVVAVASDNPREMLGYYLVGWGFLSDQDLRYLIEMQDHFATMLGELVVKMGHINRAELEQVMQVKTQESIYDLIQWEEGSFRFIDDELPERDFLEVHLPVESFLYEGHRQRDERRRMAEVVPDSRHIPILIAQPEELTEAEIALATLIDGRRSIERIALECRVPEFTVLKFVYKCASKGVMQVASPAGEVEEVLPGQSHAPWLEAAKEANDLIGRGRLLDTVKVMAGLRERYPNDPDVTRVLLAMQEELEKRLATTEVDASSVLAPAIELDEIVALDCDPAEGFVLSRINGQYTVEEVLNQLPGSRLHNRVILHNLVRRGLVTLRASTGVKRYRPSASSATVVDLAGASDDPFQDEGEQLHESGLGPTKEQPS